MSPAVNADTIAANVPPNNCAIGHIEAPPPTVFSDKQSCQKSYPR